jgi:hypothetical protein
VPAGLAGTGFACARSPLRGGLLVVARRRWMARLAYRPVVVGLRSWSRTPSRSPGPRGLVSRARPSPAWLHPRAAPAPPTPRLGPRPLGPSLRRTRHSASAPTSHPRLSFPPLAGSGPGRPRTASDRGRPDRPWATAGGLALAAGGMYAASTRRSPRSSAQARGGHAHREATSAGSRSTATHDSRSCSSRAGRSPRRARAWALAPSVEPVRGASGGGLRLNRFASHQSAIKRSNPHPGSSFGRGS